MAEEETNNGTVPGLSGDEATQQPSEPVEGTESEPVSNQPDPPRPEQPETPETSSPATADPPDEATMLKQVLGDLLRLIGVKARIDFTRRGDGYYANIRSRLSTGLLIGHRGSTLRALQHLTRAIVGETIEDVSPLTVDVSGYRARRESFLRKKSTAVARIVMETQREMALDLLTEREMETVQDTLKSIPGVRAYALGTGTRRNIIIAPIHD